MNKQVLQTVCKQTFDEIIRDMNEREIHVSPVFRITNAQDEIIRSVKIAEKVEHFSVMFPDNELIKELLNVQ